MKITVTIDVTTDRPDGTSTRRSETLKFTCGDNPRHEHSEITECVHAAAHRFTAEEK